MSTPPSTPHSTLAERLARIRERAGAAAAEVDAAVRTQRDRIRAEADRRRAESAAFCAELDRTASDRRAGRNAWSRPATPADDEVTFDLPDDEDARGAGPGRPDSDQRDRPPTPAGPPPAPGPLPNPPTTPVTDPVPTPLSSPVPGSPPTPSTPPTPPAPPRTATNRLVDDEDDFADTDWTSD
ncbi:hypothetical protein SAMN05421810_105392 [Amycolatopsis arida]|uniref:Uncharacterized protein n=1 Tax=Amycolatopsis arida TaxID=587909 RepID=A0A1I5X262_9PSEU|nr:hypothetical protein [Amycolatopsis arida]TDX92566.1 hypothetical protein CLV69_105411 [Amycolatopsis arida]SFQ26000.1 hypothetical protein SAMN05421810_105392 [Amycolatopsis arida]